MNLNNIYANAAYLGALGGMLSGRMIDSTNPVDYASLRAAALAFASAVDALIPFDGLVTTPAQNTQLAVTTNTIAANETFRSGLLQQICSGVWSGRVASASEATAAAATLAPAVITLWTAALADLATP
jgi:hypothetical protein